MAGADATEVTEELRNEAAPAKKKPRARTPATQAS